MGLNEYDLQMLRGAPRLERLPHISIADRLVPVALDFRSRLLGLARLEREDVGEGLLIPRCSSVHTFGMRFPLDVAFLDREGDVLRWYVGVPPRRLLRHPGAYAALEVPSGRSLPIEQALAGEAGVLVDLFGGI